MKFVDAPPPDLSEAFVAAFKADSGLARVKNHEVETRTGRLKLIFHGCPWYSKDDDTVRLRMSLLALLEVLESFGFSLYGSFHQVQSNWEPDVLVVHRQKSWVPGMPVFHG